jgi:hypothetical protein
MTTYNDQVISFHNQAGGQQHSPKHSLLVFLQRLSNSQETISSIGFLRMVNEVDDLRVVQIKSLELELIQHDLRRFNLHVFSIAVAQTGVKGELIRNC